MRHFRHFCHFSYDLQDRAMTSNDFARYLHLHRVRTTLQLITPYLKIGIRVDMRALLKELRSQPGIAIYAAAGHPGGASPAMPEAIDDARFEKMTDDQIGRVVDDVRLCLRLHYGERSRMWRDCSD